MGFSLYDPLPIVSASSTFTTAVQTTGCVDEAVMVIPEFMEDSYKQALTGSAMHMLTPEEQRLCCNQGQILKIIDGKTELNRR
jgi:hypothetical protein